jgi:hypothetical protein
MKAFDTPCTAELTYTKFLEERGATRDKLIEAAENLNRKLKSVGAKYTRFDLDEAWKPFTGDGRVYIFVPYLQVLEAGGQKGTVKAYFIGISENDGSSWRFVDGVNASPENIRMIIPSYSGEPLPSKSIEPPGAPR